MLDKFIGRVSENGAIFRQLRTTPKTPSFRVMPFQDQLTFSAVQDMYEHYSADQIIETFEELDLLLVNEGIKRELSEEFILRYEFVFYLLKRTLREMDPKRTPVAKP